MAAVTAALVKELRERTGVGMMECKKALEESEGNIDEAVTILRKSGQAKAAKKLDRVAAEGVVSLKISDDQRAAIMLEINCETDFASRDENFLEFVNLVTEHALKSQIDSVDSLLHSSLASGQTVLDALNSLIAKIGENITVRRIRSFGLDQAGAIYSYIHGNGKIGVLVALSSVNPELGKDLSMHVAAAKPVAILPEELPADLINKEREIHLAQLKDSGKPAEILDKIIAGKIQKFINDMVLVGQSFIKDPDITVKNLLDKSKAVVYQFARFEVGEGIEKKEVDFAAEVKAQAEAKK